MKHICQRCRCDLGLARIWVSGCWLASFPMSLDSFSINGRLPDGHLWIFNFASILTTFRNTSLGICRILITWNKHALNQHLSCNIIVICYAGLIMKWNLWFGLHMGRREVWVVRLHNWGPAYIHISSCFPSSPYLGFRRTPLPTKGRCISWEGVEPWKAIMGLLESSDNQVVLFGGERFWNIACLFWF